MIYENKQELYEAYKRIKDAYLNSSDCSIRVSSSILETNVKSYRFKPENTHGFNYRKSIYKITKKYNGLEHIYYFQGLAGAILFMVKNQFEPKAHSGALKSYVASNYVEFPCNMFIKI